VPLPVFALLDEPADSAHRRCVPVQMLSGRSHRNARQLVYDKRARWSLLSGKTEVGDLTLPKQYELVFEPAGDEPGPALRLVFGVVDGVPQCREVHLVSSEHGREVRRTDLRSIALEDHLETATLTVAQPVAEGRREDGKFVMTLDQSGLDGYRRTVQSARRTAQRRGPGEPELREAAEIYQSTDHPPTVAVAERFGIKHRTASLWIARARKLG
jgi:hypothetical protein